MKGGINHQRPRRLHRNPWDKKNLVMIIFLVTIIFAGILPAVEGCWWRWWRYRWRKSIDVDVFTNSAEWGIIPTKEINMSVFADGIYLDTYISDELGEFENIDLLYGKNYSYEIESYGVSDYLSGYFTNGALSIELPTILATITFYNDADGSLAGNTAIDFKLRSLPGFGELASITLTTDVNGEVAIEMPIASVLYYWDMVTDLNYRVQEFYQASPATFSKDFNLTSESYDYFNRTIPSPPSVPCVSYNSRGLPLIYTPNHIK